MKELINKIYEQYTEVSHLTLKHIDTDVTSYGITLHGDMNNFIDFYIDSDVSVFVKPVFNEIVVDDFTSIEIKFIYKSKFETYVTKTIEDIETDKQTLILNQLNQQIENLYHIFSIHDMESDLNLSDLVNMDSIELKKLYEFLYIKSTLTSF